MNAKAPAHLEKGVFLISSPDIEPGIYYRSVILLCEHTSAGSFGLIINKPLTLEAPEQALGIDKISHEKVSFRLGGRMQQNQMMLLHSSDQNASQTLKVLDGVYLGGDVAFLQESTSSEKCPSILLCFGYTGWITGELEKEFMHGMWFIAPATPELVFDTHPEKLWQTLLRNMGGKYAALSMIPEDLTLN